MMTYLTIKALEELDTESWYLQRQVGAIHEVIV